MSEQPTWGNTATLSAALTARGWKRLPPYPQTTPQVGDILLNDANHVAVCTAPGMMSYASIDENGKISGGKPGDQTGRETRTVSGFYYSRGWNCILRYTGAESGPQEATGASTLTATGKWDTATTLALQAYFGTTQDGIISGQNAGDMAAINGGGLLRETWHIGSGGSDVIYALQAKLGVRTDRYFGVKSLRALQTYLGTTVDGCVSNPSDVVRELQRRLIAGTF